LMFSLCQKFYSQRARGYGSTETTNAHCEEFS
jgi:hypothetical protein